MAMERPPLLLLVIFLGFSYIICLNAVPATRIGTQMHGNVASTQPLVDSSLGLKEGIRDEKLIKGRMDVELDDYPGSGANNRHTPRCFDC